MYANTVEDNGTITSSTLANRSMSTTAPPPDGQTSTGNQLADKSTAVALLLSIFLSPLGYYYVGRTKLAIVNFLTLNFLLLGIIIVPIHTYKIMSSAKNTQST